MFTMPLMIEPTMNVPGPPRNVAAVNARSLGDPARMGPLGGLLGGGEDRKIQRAILYPEAHGRRICDRGQRHLTVGRVG